jgi:membrane-bound lytic murein transglycosylase B
MRSQKGQRALIGALVVCAALALPAAASAARPSMTVKIPARQDVDNVYVLAAIHQKHCSLQVSGSVLGHRFKGFRDSSVTIHLTNQARLRLSASAKRAVKRALKKGRTVRAKITVVARNRSGQRNTVTRSVKLRS